MKSSNSIRQTVIRHEKTIGALGALMASAMMLSILEIFLSNLRGDTAIIIQPMATFLSGVVWGLYGYGKRDIFILIPNALALFLGFITVLSALV